MSGRAPAAGNRSRARRQPLHGRCGGLRCWEDLKAPATAALIREHVGTGGGLALDLGCGSAAVAAALAADFDGVVGLDLDPSAVRQARARGVPVVRGHAERLPFGDAGFDCVYSYGALHHTRLERSLPEVARVLVPGGVAVLADFHGDLGPPAGRGPRRILPILRAALAAFPAYARRAGTLTALRVTAYRLSPAWIRHVRRDVFLSPVEFRAEFQTFLQEAYFHQQNGLIVVVWRKSPEPAPGRTA
ncbi:class I SAM-dependent methyltransferase [Streptomyces sp. NPDC058092]|uniref:class I SAM-dependent methyltransferase n=1 Tax=Streptomyces sp. NPDC058092 TaxID=3346336 RepID=UPI0036E28780